VEEGVVGNGFLEERWGLDQTRLNPRVDSGSTQISHAAEHLLEAEATINNNINNINIINYINNINTINYISTI